METVMRFLKKYQVKTGTFNYVLLTYPTGKYKIPDTKEVTQDLHRIIRNCRDSNIDFGLCECHDEDIDEPLYYDLDFSLLNEVSIHDCVLNKLIHIIHDTIKKFFVVTDNDLDVFVFQKPNFMEKRINEGYWHVGIHLLYPFIRTKELERQIIYTKVIKEVKRQGIFNELPLYEDRIDQIIDHRVIRTNAIIKYGCNKTGKERYELFAIYDHNLLMKENAYTEEELFDITSIRYNLWSSHKIKTLPKPNVDIDKLKQELLIENSLKKEASNLGRDIKKKDKPFDKDTYDRVKRLVSMLSKKRASAYDSWIQVGLCLHNISDSEDMMELWKEWSFTTPEKAAKTPFAKIWKSFKQRIDGLKIGTLSLWAKEDNEREFLLFKLDEIDKKIKASIDENTHYDIAKVLREMYDGIYVCSSLKNKQWYEFRGHSYVEIQEGYTLFINISEDLVREYNRKEVDLEQNILDLKKKLINNEVENIQQIKQEIDQLGVKVISIKKIVERLKDSTFKTKVMAEARNLFHDEEFDKRLNESRHLIVFNNGVYDLDKREFRNGRPEDYMSFTTGINFMEYTENDPDIQKVYHIFYQIHPSDENRHFFFTTLAAGLHGTKKEQKLDIWTGTGSNGKSITVDFLSKALGDYFDSPPITMLTRKRGGSASASPDLAKLKGKRITSFLEPEYNDTLHTSIMKQFFGNDWIEARGLFKDPIKFKPQASGFLACNDLPQIPSNDGGTWRRIRVLEFKSKFVQCPKAPNEFKADPKLPEQIDFLVEAFMAILLHYWDRFVRSGFIIHEPDDVKEFTRKYQTDSDLYLEFMEDCIETVDDQKVRLPFKQVWDMFKIWFKDSYPNTKAPGKNELKKQLDLKLGELPKNSRGWVGKQLRENQDGRRDWNDSNANSF